MHVEERRVLILLSIAGLVAILSSTASKSPTLPLFAEYLGAKSSEMGVIAAASTLVGIVVNVTAGALSDIYGRRKNAPNIRFFFASSPFLYLLVREPWQLIIVRVYHGVATAVFTPAAIAAIADIYHERRGEMMGYFSSATLLGRLMASSIAGTMITLYSFYATYMLCGVFGIIALIVLLGFPETSKVRSTRRKVNVRLLSILTNVRIIAASCIMALTYFAMQSIETFLPLYMETLKVESWLIGVTFTIELAVIALLKPYGGRLYDCIGEGKVIGIGVVLSSLGVALIAFSTTYIFILLKESHGTALGAMETIKDVGQALGPIAMGAILMFTTYKLAFIIVAIVTLTSLLLNIVLRNRK